jgi:hypothetical protein
MMFVSDRSDPWDLVGQYVSALAQGSYLALSHLTDDYKPPVTAERFRAVFDHATEHLYFRSRAQIARFFDGMELVPPYPGAQPAVCYTGLWGAEDPVLADSDGARWLYCGVLPGSRDCQAHRRQAHRRRARHRPRGPDLASLRLRNWRDRGGVRARRTFGGQDERRGGDDERRGGHDS